MHCLNKVQSVTRIDLSNLICILDSYSNSDTNVSDTLDSGSIFTNTSVEENSEMNLHDPSTQKTVVPSSSQSSSTMDVPSSSETLDVST